MANDITEKLAIFIKLLAFLLLVTLCSLSYAGKIFVSDNTLKQAEQEDGILAKKRLLAWQALVNNNQQEPELVKLKLVNQFFNRIKYAPDRDEWGKRNYWATPIEFLSRGAGDCEDFALAKYYSLRAMGVPVDKLRLTYVKSLRLNQAHMVLTYYESATEEPFILDNLRSMILFSSERPDLKPVYSFNEDALWVTKSIDRKGSGKRVGKANRLNLWNDWKARMSEQGLK